AIGQPERWAAFRFRETVDAQRAWRRRGVGRRRFVLRMSHERLRARFDRHDVRQAFQPDESGAWICGNAVKLESLTYGRRIVYVYPLNGKVDSELTEVPAPPCR